MNNARPGAGILHRPLYYTLIASSMSLWVTGAAWLVLRHFGQSEGEFGVVAHPLEPVMLQLHGLVLIPALLSLGGVLFGHIGNAWNYRKNKVSGLLMLALFALLIGTGYILYYTGDDALRRASSLGHWVTGLAAPAVFVQHVLKRAKRRLPSYRRARMREPSLQPQGQ